MSNKFMRLPKQLIYKKRQAKMRLGLMNNLVRFLDLSGYPFICSIQISIISFILLLPVHGSTQDAQLPIYQIDESRYEMRNYDEDGKLQFYQIFNTGSVSENDNMYHLPIEMYSYDEEGELQDSTKAIYYSHPGDTVLVFFVHPFNDYSEGTEIKVDLKDTSAIYPVDSDTSWQMEAIEFEMVIDKGLSSFLGGKSEVKISNRHIAPNDTLRDGQFQINSRIDLKLYVLNVKIMEYYYNVTEFVDRQRGVFRQKFKSGDGSFFTVHEI